MNRAEKEEYVIRLHKEYKSTREIAKLTHMSFRDIGAVIRKKAKLDAVGETEPLDGDDIKSKSKTTQAIKLFSELKSPEEVVIELDLPTDQVQAICLEYWDLVGMGKLAQIYEENRYDIHDLLRLHRMVKALGLEKQDIINALEFAKHGQLRTLQWKTAYLRYQIDKLETEKAEAMEHLFKLKRRIGETENTLAQKRREITQMNQESGKCDNTNNADPITRHPE
jgi:hypothetical protein